MQFGQFHGVVYIAVSLEIVKLHIFLPTRSPRFVVMQRGHVAESDFVLVYFMYVVMRGLI